MSTNKSLEGKKILLVEGFTRQVMPMMQALHELSCHVTTYNKSKLDMGYTSHYPDKKIIAFWDREDEQASFEALIEVLKKDKYDVVIPLTDFSAGVLARFKPQLSQYAAISSNEWDVFIQARDKLETMRVCMENDIPCPYTVLDAQSVEDIINSDITYPFVIKPRVSYGGIGFHCIENKEQLLKVFDGAHELYGEMLAQEYIPQTDTQYQCEIVMDKQGQVKSAVLFNKTRWYPVDGGSSCCNTVIDSPDIVENCVKVLRAIGWRGYADIDLIQDPRDGVAKIMEINPRVTAGVKICFYAGVNIARQLVEDALEMPVTEYKITNMGCRLRYLHTDLLWFIESKNRFSTKPSWFSWKHTTDQIWSIKDPLPWFSYTLQGLMKFKKEKQKRKR